MRVLLYVLLTSACVLGDDSENRRSKLPYIADAVGNTLPPPSGGPATVGSPVNLLTPDRYEFYTFDESGELVKRLMTLEEIQAIVAAGEETEGLVTFANENQPTIAFNFSQPPYTKVHNVVTNVQNVLKAQMEAHKNKPPSQPTLDTPDVSDSWSLILPSIFGNTGVDIVPDKMSGTFTTPETETIEIDRPIDDNSISKEGSNQILTSSTTTVKDVKQETKVVPVTEKLNSTTDKIKMTSTTSSTTTTTQKPTMPTTSTAKPRTTTSKFTTTTTKATTAKPRTTTSTTTSRPHTPSTTGKPRTTTSSKSTTKVVKTTPKPITTKLSSTSKSPTTQKDSEGNFTRIQTQTQPSTISTTEKSTIKYEKISTFIPLSTAAYVTERSTQKPTHSTKASIATTTKRFISTTKAPLSSTPKPQPSITTYKPSISTMNYVSSTQKKESEKFNATTITTQSVSPSTAVTSTEFMSIGHHIPSTAKKPSPSNENNSGIKQNDVEISQFDVAQSFSQIASDLGGNYQPLPTTSDLLDSTKINDMNLESKENIEIDIPTEGEKEAEIRKTDTNNNQNKSTDNFIKISTLDPHSQHENSEITKEPNIDTENKIMDVSTLQTTLKVDTTTDMSISTTITTIDPVISDSMDNLLSQVVNQVPQSIINQTFTTEKSQFLDKASETHENAQKLEEKEQSSKTKEQISGSKNLTFTSLSTANETKESAFLQLNKINDKIDTKSNESLQETEKKQNLVKIPANNTDEQKNIESTTKLTILKPQKHEVNNKNKTLDIKTQISTKLENNTQHSVNKIEEDKVKNVTGTLKTESSNKLLNGTKTTENIISNANKIISADNNKIIGKEKDNIQDGLSLPKVDEFKKKFQKVNIDDKELANERNNSWKLISTVSPPQGNEIPKDKLKIDGQDHTDDKDIVLEFSKENQGLEVTTKDLGEDIAQFTELCNELAFRYWHAMTENIDKRRSFVLSPYSITSMLAMMFMGARGATSGEMNEILKLDDMVTFNPHFTLKNISDSIETTPASGVIVSAFVRELFSDRSKGKILTFYKERAQHFYNGHVEEINFKLISDIIRRRTNLLVKRYSWGRIAEYMKANTITMQPPLAAFSANIFQTDCSGSSVEGRDGEMYFVVSPNVRQRRLVPVPAVVYRSGFLAGYDPVLDATAAALGNTNTVISTLFLMPGQQGNIVHAEDLEALEKRLLDSNPTTPAWNRLLRTLLPRIGLELQIPRFSHKSIFNVSTTLQKMGLKELFDPDHADLGGLNGPSKDLYLSDMVQSTTFVTCGEGVIGEQHHIEDYPENLSGPQRRRTSRWVTGWDEPRDYQRAFHDPHDVGEAMHLPLHLRPRQARLPARNAQPARLKFDRPFLYFVRHNPSGMILYVGRYNPRLLP